MAKLPEDFVDIANQRYKEATRFWQNWKGEARAEYAFIAGDQWLADDLTILEKDKRPSITFNYSEKMIDAVVGAEVSNRQEVTYRPRELTDAPLAEIWTNASKWVRDEGNIEDEETDAFRDCLICGMGWTHTRVSYEFDPDGMIEVNRVDPVDMKADPSATKPGLVDRRYSFREWWIDDQIVKRQWPEAITLGTDPLHEPPGVDVITRGQRYDGDESDDPELHRGQTQIRHYECVEQEPFYRVATEGSIMEVPASDFRGMKADLDAKNITYIKQYRRVYYYAYFANDTLLEAGKSPTQEGFTYNCMTGKRDRNKNTWYGLTRVMKDPQRWANKWLSQILHIINSNAKGGLLAEVNAFVDPVKAQEEWSKPDSITLLKEGALSGQKIKEKQMANYPTGLDRLMEFALSSLPQVTGINLEALGLAGREQANVLEQSRKQAAYGLLAPIFDALRRYRKTQGRVLLDFIVNYISDGRMIRIGGPDSKQFIPLTKAPEAPRFDIIVDQAPDSPDSKAKTWEVLGQILPAMMKAGIPIPPDLLEYTPLPASLILKWKKFVSENKFSPEQVKQMQQQMQKMQEDMQQMQMKLRDKSGEMQMKQRESEQEMALAREKHKMSLQLAREEHEAKLALQQQQAEGDMEARMMEIMQGGMNDAQGNTMESINKLIQIIGQLDNESSSTKKD